MKIIWWINPDTIIDEDIRKQYENILKLLKQLRINREIDFEIIKNYNENKVYYGNKKNIYVSGTIAFFDNGIIYYINPYRYYEKSVIFLKNILEKGEMYLYKTIQNNQKLVAKKSEEKIEIEFKNKAKELGFYGNLTYKYRLSIPSLEKRDWGRASQKEIDFLHENPNGKFDIIEVKTKLNWEALGQVIGYKKLFCKERDLSEEKVNCFIVCKKDDNIIRFVCEKMNIKIKIL